MTNRVSLVGTLVDDPKVRTIEARNGTLEIVSLWLEALSGDRPQRFTIEINCLKAGAAAKAMRQGVVAEIAGQLRHDRWQDKATGKWTGKVYVAIDPGEGHIRSKSVAKAAETA